MVQVRHLARRQRQRSGASGSELNRQLTSIGRRCRSDAGHRRHRGLCAGISRFTLQPNGYRMRDNRSRLTAPWSAARGRWRSWTATRSRSATCSCALSPAPRGCSRDAASLGPAADDGSSAPPPMMAPPAYAQPPWGMPSLATRRSPPRQLADAAADAAALQPAAASVPVDGAAAGRLAACPQAQRRRSRSR